MAHRQVSSLGAVDSAHHARAKRDGPSPIVAPHWAIHLGTYRRSARIERIFLAANGARRALCSFTLPFWAGAFPYKRRGKMPSRLIAKQKRAAAPPAIPPRRRAQPARTQRTGRHPAVAPPPAAAGAQHPPARGGEQAWQAAKYRFRHRESRSAREVSCRISPWVPALMRPTWTRRGGACPPRAPPTTCADPVLDAFARLL